MDTEEVKKIYAKKKKRSARVSKRYSNADEMAEAISTPHKKGSKSYWGSR